MALASVVGGFVYPPHSGMSNATSQEMTLTAAAHKASLVFTVPKTGTLDKFEWRTAAVVQAPANGVRCSFQDVSNGDPDGTQDQYRDITSGLTATTWQTPGLMTSDGTDLGTKRSVTKGDVLACVVEFVSFLAGDDLDVSSSSGTSPMTQGCQMPYSNHFTAAWAKTEDSMVVALKYNDGTYEQVGPSVIPYSNITLQVFNNSDTPDELGNIITLPFKCAVDGFHGMLDVDAACDVVLYDSDGSTVLASVSLDSNLRELTSVGPIFYFFDSVVTLEADTAYRLVLKPTSVSDVGMNIYHFNAAAILDGMPGGQAVHQTERTDAGAWTETTTQRAWLSLNVVQLGDEAGGAGGGGMVVIGG